jgi:hypothetical protein
MVNKWETVEIGGPLGYAVAVTSGITLNMLILVLALF